jgi:hypothetical protein
MPFSRRDPGRLGHSVEVVGADDGRPVADAEGSAAVRALRFCRDDAGLFLVWVTEDYGASRMHLP